MITAITYWYTIKLGRINICTIKFPFNNKKKKNTTENWAEQKKVGEVQQILLLLKSSI